MLHFQKNTADKLREMRELGDKILNVGGKRTALAARVLTKPETFWRCLDSRLGGGGRLSTEPPEEGVHTV